MEPIATGANAAIVDRYARDAFLDYDFMQEENNSEVDVIVPTFREVDNVTPLVDRLRSVRDKFGFALNVTSS
jgi:hypothetical protein